MNTEQFTAALTAAAPTAAGRQLKVSPAPLGGSDVWVTLINLPAGIGEAGGGAEAMNNRILFIVRGGVGGASAKVEQCSSAFPRSYSLRAKTATPEKLAAYLGAFLEKLASEIAPKFTHTNP